MTTSAASLAKLSRPRLFEALARERLFSLLDMLRQRHSVVWVSAQAGAGKTTFVASYLAARKLRGIWYQVDSGDADPATFFYYLGQAAKTLLGRAKTPLPLLTPEYLPNLAGFTRVYFRDLFARLGKAGVLVLDNFQEALEDSAFHEIIVTALTEIPLGPTIIIVSRNEPPNAYIRFVVNKQIAVIDWEHMRLAPEEARGIARLQGAVDEETIDVLHERSGGWAAGLTLLLERLRRGAKLDEIYQPESLQDIFNYFAGQILAKASQEDRHTLLHLAFLPRLTPHLAIQLSENPRAYKLLETLCRRHLFTHRRHASDTGVGANPDAGARYTYQFHALFREFLQHEARDTYSPKKLAEIGARAAALLESAGHKEDALALHMENKNWRLACDAALELAPIMLQQGRNDALIDYLRRIRVEDATANPWLKYWLGIALAPNHWIEGRKVLTSAFEAFEAAGNTLGQMLAASGAVQTFFYDYDLFRPLDKWLDILEQLLAREPAFPAPGAELQVFTMTFLGMAHRRPWHSSQTIWTERILRLLEHERDANLRTFVGFALLWWINQAREWRLFDRLKAAVGAAAEDQSVVVINKLSWMLQIPFFFQYSGRPLESIPLFQQCEAINQASGLQRKLVSFWATWGLAYDYLRTREVERSQACIETIDAELSRDCAVEVSFTTAVRAAIALHRGETILAKEHLRKSIASIDSTGIPFYSNQFKLDSFVFGMLELHEFETAIECLDKCQSICRDVLAIEVSCSTLFARAYAALLKGDETLARACLSEALPLARARRYAYVFAIFPNVLPRLMEQALIAGIETDYVKTVIRDFCLKPHVPELEQWPRPIKIYALGKFKVQLNGTPLQSPRKAPRRLLLLLKALVAFGGEDIPEEQLTDAIWPELEADAAHEAFSVAVRRLRTLLGRPEAIRQRDGRLSLDDTYCWVDAFAFDRLVNEDRSEDERTRGLKLYCGNLLADETGGTWCHNARDRLHRKFVHHLHAAARYEEDKGNVDAARNLYLHGLEVDNMAESFYQGLIRCYMRLNQRAEALGIFHRMKRTLLAELGISLSPTSEALGRELLSE